jgi:hypothetical protein
MDLHSQACELICNIHESLRGRLNTKDHFYPFQKSSMQYGKANRLKDVRFKAVTVMVMNNSIF